MEFKLKKGGIRASEAKDIAIDIRKNRIQLRDLIAERNALDTNTVEGQAENARFNCLVSLCLVDNETGKPVYKNMDDYLENSTDEEAFLGAQTLAQMMYGLDKDFEKKLPENKFLVDYGFANENLHLINKEGNLIDVDGNLIDEQGRYIDKDGNVIDREGRKVNEEGQYEVESQPFLDENNNPIELPAKKKRGRPPKNKE